MSDADRRQSPVPSLLQKMGGTGGLLQDAAAFAALALFVFAVVWLAAEAGALVAAWRMGAV